MMSASLLYKTAHRLTIFTLLFFIGVGIIMVAFPVKPFWIDEWRLIINLKFKSPAALWGVLDHNQQCPRLYLQVLKQLTGAGDYSYTALRLPSFIVHSLSLIFCYYVSGLIFGKRHPGRFLWFILFASFNTSVHYFVQIKQYSMEMGLSIMGFWQVYLLFYTAKRSFLQELLLALGFLLGPLLSYTYPMVAAPVFTAWLLVHWEAGILRPQLRRLILPLCCFITGIIIVYFTDMRQVFRHKFMQDFWADYIMKDGFSIRLFVRNVYWLFAQMGAGDLFEIIFGITGLSAWLYAHVRVVQFIRRRQTVTVYMLYATLLIDLCILLFICHKLPMGQQRVNAFMVPCIACLLVYGVEALVTAGRKGVRIGAMTVAGLLFLAGTGNIYSSFINDLTDEEHDRLLAIYRNCNRSIRTARLQHYALAATPEAGYPLQVEVTGDWVLQAQPAYPATDGPVIYSIARAAQADSLFRALPVRPSGMIVVDGSRSYILSHP